MARARISLSGYMDSTRRPRWIIWTLVAVIVIAGIMVPVLGLTSTRWFCSEGCHKVQDDTITSYKHSSHSEISCMACHMPVNANPIVFLLHKAEALGELAQTVTNNYQLPLNANNEVALTMPSTQCTQCHNEQKRKITPSAGLKIDHNVHAANGVQCTICHNRIAHNENFDLALFDPKTGNPNQKHTNFMTMTACFRCHTQEIVKKNTPQGECFLCHTKDFNLLPVSHRDPNFFAGHGALGKAEEARAPWMNATTATVEAEAKAKGVDEKDRYAGENLPTVDSVNLCSTCHSRSFCTDCHGLPMPHQGDFVKRHGNIAAKDTGVCVKCHGSGTASCSACHHGTEINYTILPKVTWLKQHPLAVNSVGAAACVQPGGCHAPTYCAECHANNGTLPPGAPPF